MSVRQQNVVEKLLEEYIGKNEDSKRKLKVISERLNEEQMKKLIQKESIKLIVDASHPYAVNVSSSAIKVTDKMNVKYIRFERKMLDYGSENVKKFVLSLMLLNLSEKWRIKIY